MDPCGLHGCERGEHLLLAGVLFGQTKVVGERPDEHVVFLGDHRHRRMQRLLGDPRHLGAPDGDRAVRGRVDPRHEAAQRGFAGSRGADDRQPLPFAHVQAHAVEHLFSVAIGESHVGDRQVAAAGRPVGPRALRRPVGRLGIRRSPRIRGLSIRRDFRILPLCGRGLITLPVTGRPVVGRPGAGSSVAEGLFDAEDPGEGGRGELYLVDPPSDDPQGVAQLKRVEGDGGHGPQGGAPVGDHAGSHEDDEEHGQGDDDLHAQREQAADPSRVALVAPHLANERVHSGHAHRPQALGVGGRVLLDRLRDDAGHPRAHRRDREVGGDRAAEVPADRVEERDDRYDGERSQTQVGQECGADGRDDRHGQDEDAVGPLLEEALDFFDVVGRAAEHVACSGRLDGAERHVGDGPHDPVAQFRQDPFGQAVGPVLAHVADGRLHDDHGAQHEDAGADGPRPGALGHGVDRAPDEDGGDHAHERHGQLQGEDEGEVRAPSPQDRQQASANGPRVGDREPHAPSPRWTVAW